MTVNELVSILKTLTGKEVLVYFLKFADKIINISNENENISLYVLPKGVLKDLLVRMTYFTKQKTYILLKRQKRLAAMKRLFQAKRTFLQKAK